MAGPPYIDSAEKNDFPFYAPPVSSGPVRAVAGLDRPGATFPAFVDQNGNRLGGNPSGNYFRLAAISGENHFRTTIAARSQHVRRSYVIIHELCWKSMIDLTLGKLSPHVDLDKKYDMPILSRMVEQPSVRNGTFEMVSPTFIRPNPPSKYEIEIAGPKATDLETALYKP